MTCTGAGVSVSVRLIMDPVTTISCKSVVLFEDDAVACCAPAEPAPSKATDALAAAKVLIETGKPIQRRSACSQCLFHKSPKCFALVMLRECFIRSLIAGA